MTPPPSAPQLNQTNGTIYLSWSGAVEVRYWRIEEANRTNATDDGFRKIMRAVKDGFETVCSHDQSPGKRYASSF